jgi:hypothetical protein
MTGIQPGQKSFALNRAGAAYCITLAADDTTRSATIHNGGETAGIIV